MTDQPKKCLSVCLFGVGRAGRIHIDGLQRTLKLRLAYIVDTNFTLAEEIAQRYHGVTPLRAGDADVAFNDLNVDVCLIASPTETHHDYVCRAIRAGKHVFCEKPLAPTLEETRLCYEEAERRGVRLFCAFNRRYDPSFARVVQGVRNGTVGKVHTARTISRDSLPLPVEYLRTSGGFFHDCIIHDLDLLCWMIGENPTRVFAMTSNFSNELREMGDPDTAMVTLRFPSGALAHVECSRLCPFGYDQRLEVFGENGSLMAENRLPTSYVQHTGLAPHANVHIRDGIYPNFATRYEQAYLLEMDHFANICNDRSLRCDVSKADVLRAIYLAHACVESFQSGRPIDLSCPEF